MRLGALAMQRCNKGFTLVELLIVMVMFILVIMAASSSFNVLLTQMTKLTKSEESNIAGVVGLEMMRHDLQQAGFGLPSAYMATPPTYIEATVVPANQYNDAPNGLPRAVIAGDNVTASTVTDGAVTYNILANTDYLALKGVTLGMDDVSQKWTYMPYSSGITGKKKPRIWPAANLNLTASSDQVILLKNSIVNSKLVKQMVYDESTPGTYWAKFDPDGFGDTLSPTLPEDIFYIYGIMKDINDPAKIGMPFNRADYFVATPSDANRRPAFCAPNTGLLYKATVNQDGGGLVPTPLLDCVADMQIVFGWDLTDAMGNQGQDGIIDSWSSPVSTSGAITVVPSTSLALVTGSLGDPERIRNSLKIIKVYILSQVGRRDSNYQSQASFIVGGQDESSLTKNYNLTADMRNYRWKLYQLTVRPKNLTGNQ
jgi:prepilin-type N-terminal cleavage/methylation domain-containing protein